MLTKSRGRNVKESFGGSRNKKSLCELCEKYNGGKNNQALRFKGVKGAARTNFKKNMPSSAKPNDKLDKAITSEVKAHVFKSKEAMDMGILQRMKEMQSQQQETFQACADWSQALPIVNGHMDTEAAAFVHNLRNSRVKEDKMLVGTKPELTQQEASGKVGFAQQVEDGSRMPLSQTTL